MGEVYVECVCGEYNISDIGVRFRRGDGVWIPERVAQSSRELKLAQQIGAVTVSYIKRCIVTRTPPPPMTRLARIRRSAAVGGVNTPPPVAQPAPEQKTAPIDTSNLEAAIERGVAKAIAGLIQSGALVPATNPARPQQPLPVIVTETTPLYIPTGIVPMDAPTVQVTQQSSEGSDVDAAAAALKAARKRK